MYEILVVCFFYMDERVSCVEMLNVRSWVRCLRDTSLILEILPKLSVLSGMPSGMPSGMSSGMLSVRWHIVYRVLMQQERSLLDGGVWLPYKMAVTLRMDCFSILHCIFLCL